MALIKCSECNTEVSDAAPSCPQCGHPVAADIARKRARIAADKRTKRNAIIALCVIGVVGLLMTLPRKGTPPNEAVGHVAEPEAAPAVPPLRATKPVFEITASRLYDMYETNEVAADDLMRGKIVHVGGRVQSIDKDFMDHVVIHLETSNEFSSAMMRLADQEKPTAATLRKGESVVISCNRIARVLNSPSGSDCTFVREPD